MRRYELTDEQWELIAGLFPSQRGRGRRFRDHRSMVNAMMWILNTGSPWRDLPERRGTPLSIHVTAGQTHEIKDLSPR